MKELARQGLLVANLLYNWLSFMKDVYKLQYLDAFRHFITAASVAGFEMEQFAKQRAMRFLILISTTLSSAISVHRDLGYPIPEIKVTAYDASIMFGVTIALVQYLGKKDEIEK